MANITKLEMASALAARNDIKITKSFFGLCNSAIYIPTNSKLTAFKHSYAPEQLPLIERLLSASTDRLASMVSDFHLEQTQVGNVRLEGCVSQDKSFVAVQILRYQDYLYHPVSAPVFYQGDAARLIAQALL